MEFNLVLLQRVMRVSLRLKKLTRKLDLAARNWDVDRYNSLLAHIEDLMAYLALDLKELQPFVTCGAPVTPEKGVSV